MSVIIFYKSVFFDIILTKKKISSQIALQTGEVFHQVFPPCSRYCAAKTLADTHIFVHCHHFAVLQCKRQVETTCPVSTAFCIVVSLVLLCFLQRNYQSSIFKMDMKASLGTLTEPT